MGAKSCPDSHRWGKLARVGAGIAAGSAALLAAAKEAAVKAASNTEATAGKADVVVTSNVVDVTKEVKYTYSAITPGPLSDDIAKTFAGGRYSEGILQPNQLLFKSGDAANPGGSFFTFEPPTSAAQTRIDNAIRPQWIDPETGRLEGRSPINSSIRATFPPGTKYYYGPVSSQGDVYVGGIEKIQIYVPNARNIGTFTPLNPLP